MKANRFALAIASGAVAGMLATLPTLAASTPPPASHEAMVEHGSRSVMPFDLDRTMHVFEPTADGGVQTVIVHDDDPQQVALVRSHLRKEAVRFARGDFSDPAAIHGTKMAGLELLRSGAKRIAVSYSDAARGARIRYATTDPQLIGAIHAWFAAQVKDHGAHAMTAR